MSTVFIYVCLKSVFKKYSVVATNKLPHLRDIKGFLILILIL